VLPDSLLAAIAIPASKIAIVVNANVFRMLRTSGK
jgi:hypothetical protein